MGKGSCGRVACTLHPDAISRSCVVGSSTSAAFRQPAVFPEIAKDKMLARYPKYNAGPGSYLPTLRLCGTDELVVEPMRWGLVPSFVKADSMEEASRQMPTMFNARSDNLARVHKRLLERNRCVVVVDGFFEWLKEDGNRAGKRPWFIRRRDGEGPLIMAGLWDRWAAPNGGPELCSCTVITTESNSSLGWLHDRLPCILEPSEVPTWLGEAFDSKAVAALLRPYPGTLHIYEVGPEVNSVRNNVAECLLSLDAYRARNRERGVARFFAPASLKQKEKDTVLCEDTHEISTEAHAEMMSRTDERSKDASRTAHAVVVLESSDDDAIPTAARSQHGDNDTVVSSVDVASGTKRNRGDSGGQAGRSPKKARPRPQAVPPRGLGMITAFFHKQP